MKKIRVLSLSKPYVASSYRQKFRILAQDPRFEIGLIAPSSWAGQAFETSDDDHYWLKVLPIFLDGHNHFHVYSQLEKAVREFKPDIFNIEEEHYSIVTAQCVYLARKYGAKTCFYTWQNIFKKYPPPFSWIEQYVFKHSAVGITGNAEAVAILRKKGFKGLAPVIPQMGADAKAIALANNASQKLSDLAAILPADAFVVGFAGRLVEEKGIQDLLQALALIDDPKVCGVIIGTGSYQDQLKKLQQSLGLQQRVFFLGSKSSTDIYRYLMRFHALALPSLTRSNWKEQFGRVLVESMLCGAVPLGSSSGEIPKVIKTSGLVFPEGRPEFLAKRIARLHSDRGLLAKLAARGKKRALANFTNEVIADKYARLFVSMMGASGTEAP